MCNWQDINKSQTQPKIILCAPTSHIGKYSNVINLTWKLQQSQTKPQIPKLELDAKAGVLNSHRGALPSHLNSPSLALLLNIQALEDIIQVLSTAKKSKEVRNKKEQKDIKCESDNRNKNCLVFCYSWVLWVERLISKYYGFKKHPNCRILNHVCHCSMPLALSPF